MNIQEKGNRRIRVLKEVEEKATELEISVLVNTELNARGAVASNA